MTSTRNLRPCCQVGRDNRLKISLPFEDAGQILYASVCLITKVNPAEWLRGQISNLSVLQGQVRSCSSHCIVSSESIRFLHLDLYSGQMIHGRMAMETNWKPAFFREHRSNSASTPLFIVAKSFFHLSACHDTIKRTRWSIDDEVRSETC